MPALAGSARGISGRPPTGSRGRATGSGIVRSALGAARVTADAVDVAYLTGRAILPTTRVSLTSSPGRFRAAGRA